jgi:hypothetical protein
LWIGQLTSAAYAVKLSYVYESTTILNNLNGSHYMSHILIKFLMKKSCKLLEICSRLKKQYGEKTPSNVGVYISGAVRLKKEGKRWRMNLMSAGQGVATL